MSVTRRRAGAVRGRGDWSEDVLARLSLFWRKKSFRHTLDGAVPRNSRAGDRTFHGFVAGILTDVLHEEQEVEAKGR